MTIVEFLITSSSFRKYNRNNNYPSNKIQAVKEIILTADLLSGKNNPIPKPLSGKITLSPNPFPLRIRERGLIFRILIGYTKNMD